MEKTRQYYQEIGRRGGKATVERHGAEHMAELGKKGFAATTTRHFGGSREAHLAWLEQAGLHAYWAGSGITMKRDRDGFGVWPEEMPVHPAHK